MPWNQAEVRNLIPISGKDSLATAIVQLARTPELPYEFFFIDVGMELPETMSWIEKAENYLGKPIQRVGRNLRDVMVEQGMLPSHNSRFCTRLGKIQPLYERIVRGDRAIQYVGIRADEDRPLVNSYTNNVQYRYPLKEIGMDLVGVWKLLDRRGILPPSFFWERVYENVWKRASDRVRRFIEGMSPWVKQSFFSWRSRSNCYMCFYQRLYEWVGLLEHHPELFAEAEALEKEFGSEGEEGIEGRIRLKDFTWRKDGSLPIVRSRADEIFSKRCSDVYMACVRAANSVQEDEMDLLSLTSCGIFCGK